MASIVRVEMLTSNDVSQDRANLLAREVARMERNSGVEVNVHVVTTVEHVEPRELDRLDPAKRKQRRRVRA